MSRVEVELSAAEGRKLEEEAARLGVTAEELVRAAVLELLERPGADFEKAAEQLLAKNRELYRRLA